MINALIVDDHEMFAEGVRAMFNQSDQVSVIASTINGHEVPELVTKLEVDVILMDISMPILDGLETMKLLHESRVTTSVLMLTMHDSFGKIKKALEYGAKGYILKNATKNELLEAIRVVSQGQNYFHPKISHQIFEYFKKGSKPDISDGSISAREKEIIALLAQGLSSHDIAEQLFLSEHTIKTHRRNIIHKMGVKNTAELIQTALKKEWI